MCFEYYSSLYEENQEEVKQKESQKESGGSKGSPVVTVSTDLQVKCKYECIYHLHTVMLMYY